MAISQAAVLTLFPQKRTFFSCLLYSLLHVKILYMSQKAAGIGKKTVLWIALLLTAIIPVYAQNTSNFTTDGKGTITKYDGREINVVIPAKIGNEQITAIGDSTFKNMGLTTRNYSQQCYSYRQRRAFRQ